MMVTHIKNALIFYHEPYASSASEMVTELAQYIKASSIDAADAQALLAGIMLDTKNFVLNTGVRTFEASAYLRRRGADTVAVKKLFSDSRGNTSKKAQLASAGRRDLPRAAPSPPPAGIMGTSASRRPRQRMSCCPSWG